MFRIISNLLIILSIFLLPPYVIIILIALATLVFDNFFESIILGLFLDTLYGSSFWGFDFAYIFTILTLVFYILSFKLKTVIRISR